MAKGSGTRSGLLWEVERLLNEVENLPQVLLMENVPQVHSKKNIDDFNKWIEFLKSKGYSCHYKDLNAKDYGVAQSRNRCFMVSILGNGTYHFPKETGLWRNMRSYLEPHVDERFYLSNEKARNLIDKLILDGKLTLPEDESIETWAADNLGSSNEDREPLANKSEVAQTLLSRDYKELSNYSSNVAIEAKRLGNVYGEDFGTSYAGNVWDAEGLCPTIMTAQGGGRQPHVVESTIVAMRGRNPENPSDRHAGIDLEQRLEPRLDGCTNTLTSVQKDNMILETVKMSECIGGFGEKKSNSGTQWYQQDRVYSMGDVALAEPSQLPGGSYNYLEIKKANVVAIDEQNMNLRADTFGTLTTDGSSPKHNNRVMEYVKVRQATKDGFIECMLPGIADLNYPSSNTRRGRVIEGGAGKRNTDNGEYP